MDQSEASSLPPSLPQRFQSLVWSCLDSDLTRSAVFHAERYFALNQSSHSARHLYATALIRERQTYSALFLVNLPRDQQCSGCLELKSRCCSILGRFRQAREALEDSMKDSCLPPPSTGTRVASTFLDEAALLCRSGTTALKGNQPEKAAESFKRALNLNPLIWEAFEGLCSLGSPPEVETLFPSRDRSSARTIPDDSFFQPNGAGFLTPENSNGTLRIPNNQPFRVPAIPSHHPLTNPTVASQDNFQHRSTKSQPAIYEQARQHITRPLSSADEAGPVQKKLRSAIRHPDTNNLARSYKMSEEKVTKKPLPRSAASSSKTSNLTSNSNNVGSRRSSRLLTGASGKQTSKSTRDRRRLPPAGSSRSAEPDDEDSYAGDIPSPPSIAHSPRSEESLSPNNMTAAQEAAFQEALEQADNYIYDITKRFASATRYLSMYESQLCLEELSLLPYVHQQSPWVLAMVSRAHFERCDYNTALRAFQALRILDPYRLWDMEVYSTLLWHLQKPVELSFLGQELLNINPRSPQAWIAVGNLFSLQKEKAQALTCFRRASQMDPSCAYAFTLSGHELVDEDLDKAITFFRSALRVDARHYNAWYGLGTCYLRQSRLRLAHYHFARAVEIHPNNAVLLGCVAMAMERRGKRGAALEVFDHAIRIAPDNALVRYRRAKIYISMRKYDDAIADLEYLRSSSPDESNVVFQLAKVYRLIGDDVKFAQVLAVARDIAPKQMSKIKKLLETVKDGGADDRMDEG